MCTIKYIQKVPQTSLSSAICKSKKPVKADESTPICLFWTCLLLQIAQDKIILQQEGDILDAKIKKAEKEIEAMENTLKVVNTSNETYRKSLTMIDKEGEFIFFNDDLALLFSPDIMNCIPLFLGPEGEELKLLEKEYYHAMVELRSQRERKAQMESEIQVLFISKHQVKYMCKILKT